MVKSSGPGTGALIMLPPPMEVARPEMKRSQLVPATGGMMDDEVWVTVYGYDVLFSNLNCLFTVFISFDLISCNKFPLRTVYPICQFWLCKRLYAFIYSTVSKH